MKITPHQAKYFAHEISAQKGGGERLTQSLFDARVDLNPHQIEAALFALNNPLQEGVLLADEVGLGKTVEAGLVLCQMWAEQKRRLLVICPASLRKQWANELTEKFALPSMVVDKAVLKPFSGSLSRLLSECSGQYVLIMSYQFAAKSADILAGGLWDYVALDEAHKLRNTHRPGNKIGQALKSALAGRRKMLLSATPLQNSLMELYGLSTLLDEHLFGDEKAFRRQYVQQAEHDELKSRLQGFVKRTLRRDVSEYIRYTRRHTLTQQFTPNDDEQAFYEAVSDFVSREHSHALPKNQRHLTALILRKLLASSPEAVKHTLEKIRLRLEKEQNRLAQSGLLDDWQDEGFGSEWLDEHTEHTENESPQLSDGLDEHKTLIEETALLQGFIEQAGRLKTDSKAAALLSALQTGFAHMSEAGAAQKAVIFTESVRTQHYLFNFLEQNGYTGKVVMFSGSNNTPHAEAVYQNWLKTADNTQISGSPQVDKRSALIAEFEHQAEIMIATEAGAEGVNLQFCSLIINYDLPWNPQRVEQRIGRCHRYGQKYDVVVINFLNRRNEADKRVLELLTDKFRLFDGVFGASDEILGRIESGVDFEKRIAEIYDTCRTPSEITAAFNTLQKSLESEIENTLAETGNKLLEHFDEDVHAHLNLQKIQSQAQLDKVGRWFWLLSRFALQHHADFDEDTKRFLLHRPPEHGIPAELYTLPAQKDKNSTAISHRLSAPLGKWCITQGLNATKPVTTLHFDYAAQTRKISILAARQGQSGWLRMDKLSFRSKVQQEERLIFTARTDDGEWLDEEFCRKLLLLPATAASTVLKPPEDLAENAIQARQAAIHYHAERNHELLAKESERLDKWAEDLKLAAQQALQDIKNQIKETKRQKQQAPNLAEQQIWEKRQRDLEKNLSRQRNKVWEIEDEIETKRDELIEKIQFQLQQTHSTEEILTIRWEIV